MCPLPFPSYLPTYSLAPSLALFPAHARSMHLLSRPQLATHAEEMRKQEEEQKRLDFEAQVGTFFLFFFTLRDCAAQNCRARLFSPSLPLPLSPSHGWSRV